jgi:hypothetical protein
MKHLDLIYYIASMLIALLMFFMKFTAPNALGEIILKTVGKLVPLFVIGYSFIQIFKILGVL